jgi:predicted O-linked N-acetylglucosamine transferase (SPINDLY family)
VQITYIGYWSTTGLTEMDWVFTDIYSPSSFQSHFSEKFWKLPRLAVCYRGDESLPDSRWKPSSEGKVWLGSFNRYCKIREATLNLWAKVMKAIPGAMLLLEDRGADDSDTHQRIVSMLGSQGIAAERIEFVPSVIGHERHMVLYDRLDIALDTIPFNSGTTACDALWMGVPIVALEGNWSGARITSTFLKAINKPEWVAQNEEEYVAIVAQLARDVEGRTALRSAQRSLVAKSPLCDSKTLAEAIQDSLEKMFDMYQAKAISDINSELYPERSDNARTSSQPASLEIR